jgi:hypothetical protein
MIVGCSLITPHFYVFEIGIRKEEAIFIKKVSTHRTDVRNRQGLAGAKRLLDCGIPLVGSRKLKIGFTDNH